jgi:hypothetical protein
MKKISIIEAGILVGCAALVTSCAQGNPTLVGSNYSSISGVTNGNTSGSLSSNVEGQYRCPASDQYNVVPNYNYNNNGTGYFQVCVDSSSTSDVLVNGKGSALPNDAICVFPVESTNTGTATEQTDWIPGPNGVPLAQCMTAGGLSANTVFNFAGVTWNAAFIVDATQQQQMIECLYYDDPSMCPQQYSYGKFR